MNSPKVSTTSNFGSPGMEFTMKCYPPSLSPPPPPMKRWILPAASTAASTAAAAAAESTTSTPLLFHTTTQSTGGGLFGTIQPKVNVPYLNNVNVDDERCRFVVSNTLPERVFLPRLLDFDDAEDSSSSDDDEDEDNKENTRDLSNEDFFKGLQVPPTTSITKRPTTTTNKKWTIQKENEDRMDIR